MRFRDLPAYQQIPEALGSRKIKVNGLWGAAEPFLLSQIASDGHPFCLIAASATQAETIYQDLSFFFRLHGVKKELLFFPPWDVLPYESSTPRSDWIARRLHTLYQLAQEPRVCVVTSIEAVLQKVRAPAQMIEKSLLLTVGSTPGKETLMTQLDACGYEITGSVTQYGEASARGGIVDIYSPTLALPVRVEFLGDTIESLRTFDPESQKSVAAISSADIIPGREALSEPHFYDTPFLSYLPSETLLVLDEPDDVLQKGKRFLERAGPADGSALRSVIGGHHHAVPRPDALYLPLSHLNDAGAERTTIDLECLSLGSSLGATRVTFDSCSIAALGLSRPGRPFSEVAGHLEILRRDHQIVVVVRNETQLARFGRLFADHQLPWITEPLAVAAPTTLAAPPAVAMPPESPTFPAPILLQMGALSEGFAFPSLKTIFCNEGIMTGGTRGSVASRPSRRGGGMPISFQEIRPSDYVVHLQHGIGRYVGLKQVPVRRNEMQRGICADFFVIEYAGGDKVYVPLDALQMVQRYVGPDGQRPEMDRLGGTRWAKTRARVGKAVREMMEPLLKLYAEREVVTGHSFIIPMSMAEAFAAAFEYEETPDQQRSIEEVIADMERTRPMDRLVCGDVGYGKTEVAMRAAFHAVMDHKQVALLAPTTLLAQQHYQTFVKRFAPFPVRVEVLSRFRSPREQKQTLADLKLGRVDILIGTHRLLQKDVQFQDLGLVVVDEEHRFGVRHKEWLKEIRKQVDVLTLTATPIPRTLQMALTQTRDLSVIETAPHDRLAIQTIMAPFDPVIIREAIFRELVRGGQVFFVHNRVQNIEQIGAYLAELVPEAKIGVAHGQMREQMLEEVISKFIGREYTLLLTTTIIESGIDIPTANTIFINNADQFGLAELYQLRGRVGRAAEQGYAYLLVREDRILTEEAQMRLRAIQEFSELGSGFKLAARDLEIRGAGNLLGGEQSGQVAAVGFEMYVKMIEEMVQEIRGKGVPVEIDPALQFQAAAYIPDIYVPDASQRLLLYKRFSGCQTDIEVEALLLEMDDRFGTVPEAVQQLAEIVRFKQMAKAARILKIVEKEDALLFVLSPSVAITDAHLRKLMAQFKMRFTAEFSFEIDLQNHHWETVRNMTRRCLEHLILTTS
jgi:transcription-repair coupling factor (superfamily II helicase)